jgi:hypothetical protein
MTLYPGIGQFFIERCLMHARPLDLIISLFSLYGLNTKTPIEKWGGRGVIVKKRSVSPSQIPLLFE